MLTGRYAAWAAQGAQRDSMAVSLAAIAGLLGLMLLSLAWWPEPLRPWARRGFYWILRIGYATLFLVALAALMGLAGLHW